ncbi:fungal trichothecene efflux pump family protein [Mycobacterium ulcerans str. Harvey]|uniref:Fungal trichothecene efflux pump family protein n=1 Tax=Mycobacterium ulcerans str. Harvey TaxID=1299332 RepID=A0ABP3ABQ2_MYCUL|nr:fungal trichothecene efflux pump family protein [Mycobacterium ulcerans str. Harvey]
MICVATAAIPALAATTRPVIDYAGIMFIGLSLAALTLATSLGGSVYAWGSAPIIGLFTAAGVTLAVFVWVETIAAQPILPIRLFAAPVFSVCCVLAFVVGFAMLGALIFVPTFMQYVNGVSATASGLRILPMVIGMLITSIGSGSMVGRTGRYKIFPVLGTALMTLAFLLMSRTDESTSAAVQSVYLLILGSAIGMSSQVLVIIVQNTSEFEDLGVATSGVSLFRTIGGSFGAAIFGSLFVNFLNSRLASALTATEVASSPKRCTDNPLPWRRRSCTPTPDH